MLRISPCGRFVLAFVAALSCARPTYGQPATIAGVVVDARTDRPLAGVLLLVKDTPVFAESDAEGRFQLNLAAGSYSLAASLVGYALIEQDVEVSAGAPLQLTIRLPEGTGPYTEQVTVIGRASDRSGDAPAGAVLHGRELQTVRGLGYAYGRLRYTDAGGDERFWADADQRHTINVFANYRVSNRTNLSGKVRYGSNYPIVGYVGEQARAPGAPALLGGGVPLFYSLTVDRNTLRLPAYSRVDVRADRTFTWSTRRITLFAEVVNLLNRTNLRNVPYGIDRSGRVFGPTDSLMPILPSAGLVVEF